MRQSRQVAAQPSLKPAPIPEGVCQGADVRGRFSLSLSPGMVVVGVGRGFSLLIEPNGSAQLGITGMVLADGEYVGQISALDLAKLRSALTPMLGEWRSDSMCVAPDGPEFSFTSFNGSSCFRQACLGSVGGSPLAAGYEVAIEIIARTPWQPAA